MRLLLLAVITVGVMLILVTLILAGGRGDLGDAVRRVNLPTPHSRLPRVGMLVISVLPLVMGELALAPMRRAAVIEARRVRAALASGLTLAFALVYVSLFTYAAGELDPDELQAVSAASPATAAGSISFQDLCMCLSWFCECFDRRFESRPSVKSNAHVGVIGI